MNASGTGLHPISVNHVNEFDSCVLLDARPVPGAPHLIAASFTPHNGPPRGTIGIVDTRGGKNNPRAIDMAATAAPHCPDESGADSKRPCSGGNRLS